MDFIKTYTFTATDTAQVVADFLCAQEQYILDVYPYVTDFGTGYNNEHVTTRTGTYNVFSLSCTELKDLLNFIKTSYVNYYTNVMPSSAYDGAMDPHISAWLHIVKSSEEPETHQRSPGYPVGWSFISGMYTLSADNTATIFTFNDETVSVTNVNNTVTIFPPHYRHHTINQAEGQGSSFIYFDVLFTGKSAAGDSTYFNSLIKFRDY